MPSELHEMLIDEVGYIWSGCLQAKFGSAFTPSGVKFAIDHLIGAFYLEGLPIGNRLPDFYLSLGDKKGPILGEVGNMPSGKWGSVLWKDGLPVRVLRIEFDLTIGLLNPRFTRREVTTVKILQRELWALRTKYAVAQFQY